jgi:hypothetical protein
MVGALFKHLKLKVYIACMCIHFGGKILAGKILRAHLVALNVLYFGAKFLIRNKNNFVHEGVV